MNIKTIKNSIMIFALAMVFTISHQAQAVFPLPTINGDNGIYYNYPMAPAQPTTQYVYGQGPVQYVYVTEPATTKVVKTQTTNTTTKNVVTNSSSNSNYSNSSSSSNSNELRPVVTDNTNNGLTALSLAGSGGFMPSSIWQWILVVLLIFAIIVIARMLSRPEHHEIHGVSAH